MVTTMKKEKEKKKQQQRFSSCQKSIAGAVWRPERWAGEPARPVFKPVPAFPWMWMTARQEQSSSHSPTRQHWHLGQGIHRSGQQWQLGQGVHCCHPCSSCPLPTQHQFCVPAWGVTKVYPAGWNSWMGSFLRSSTLDSWLHLPFFLPSHCLHSSATLWMMLKADFGMCDLMRSHTFCEIQHANSYSLILQN